MIPFILNARKSFRIVRIVTIAFLLFVIAAISAAQVPTITSFSPASGSVGTTVKIYGTNFNTTPANNIVYFGPTKAAVGTAYADSLFVTVPAGAAFANLTVTTGGLTAVSSKGFVPTFSGTDTIHSGSFGTRVDFNLGEHRDAKISDIDGDGKPDIVASSNFNLRVYRNTMSGGTITTSSFAVSNFAVGTTAYQIAVGDLDGDGKPDAVAAASSKSSIFRNTSTSGSVSFASRIDISSNFNTAITLSDVDCDGKLDMVIISAVVDSVFIYRNTSTIGSISFAGPVGFSVSDDAQTVQFGDVDGDGKPDMMLGQNSNTNSFAVLRNTSSPGTVDAASFAAPFFYSVSGTVRELLLADVDGDGKSDIVAAGNNSVQLKVLRNIGTPGVIDGSTFAASIGYSTAWTPNNFMIGDLTGDGKPDMATAESGYLSVLRNKSASGTVSFSASTDFFTSNAQRGVIGDLDGDARPEIVLSDQSSNALRIFQRILGAFSPSVSSIAFGSRAIGTVSQDSMTITNTGNASLTISSVTKTNALFSVSPTSATIAAGASQTFYISFTASSLGSVADTMTFVHNGPGSPSKIPLSATSAVQAQTTAGKALSFDGVNDSVVVMDSFSPTAYTVEMWVKVNSLAPQSIFVRTSSVGANAQFSHQLQFDGGKFTHYLYDQGGVAGGRAVYGTTTIVTGQWYHVAITAQNGGMMRLYVNGVEEGSAVNVTTLWTGGDRYVIGAVATGGSLGYVNGSIDEFRLWTTARTQSQIQNSYAPLAGNESGLRTYLRFDEGSGTQSLDGTGNSRNATFYNGPLWISPSTAPVSSPAYSSSGSSVAFGNKVIGIQSIDSSTVFTNTGGGVLNLSFSSNNANYTVSPSSAAVTSGSTQKLFITFLPTTSAADNGTITVTDNAAGSPHSVSLSGTGSFTAQTTAGNALSFDGVNDSVIVMDPFNPTAYTVDMWIKANSTADQNIFGRTNVSGPNTNYSHALRIYNGTFNHYTYDNVQGQRNVFGTTQIVVGQWYHIAITAQNGGMSRLYVNGTEEGTAVSINTLIATGDRYVAGSSAVSGAFGFFNGTLDELRLWNSARTQSQIRSAYVQQAGNESGLIGYWRFDETSGSVSYDGTGNEKSAAWYHSPTRVVSTAPIGAPVYSASGSSLVFGNVLATVAKQDSVTVTNTGAAYLNIGASANNGSYTVTPSSAVIASGASRKFYTTFQSDTIGAQPGKLIFAHNASSSSDTVSLSAAAVLPPTSMTFTATSITATGATFNGNVVPNSQSTAVTFEFGLTASYGTTVTVNESPLSGTSGVAVAKAVTGLIPNTLYYYRIVAVNATGTSNQSGATFTTLLAAPTATTAAATSVSDSSAVMNGSINANNSSTTNRFVFGTVSGTYTDSLDAAPGSATGISNTSVSALLDSLLPNQAIYYRVAGTSAGGYSRGSELSFTTSQITPTAVTSAATNVTDSSVIFNGTMNAHNSSTTVRFVYGAVSGTYTDSLTASPGTAAGISNTAVSVLLGNRIPNQTIYYRVAGTSGGGYSHGSEQSVTTTAVVAIAATTSATNIEETTVTLNGTVNAKNSSTVVRFLYGTVSGVYTDSINAVQSPLTGNSVSSVSASLTGLTSNTPYVVRVSASNSAGYSLGSEQTFATNAFLPLELVSFTPLADSVGRSVTITGSGFDRTPSNNVVFIGGSRATVTGGTDMTSLTVTVPAGVTYGRITVIVHNFAAQSDKFFTPTFSGPVVMNTSAFGSAASFSTLSGPQDLSIADMDGDGKPDVVVSYGGSSNFSVFRNASTGSGSITFDSKVDVATTAGNTYSLTIADLDADGKLDVATSSSNGKFSAFRNTSTLGSISFNSEVQKTAGSGSYKVGVGDLDGDGKIDVITADYDGNTLSIFQNTTSGSTLSFATRTTVATPSGPFAVGVADLDGDGSLDLVSGNNEAQSLSVFLNTTSGSSITFGSAATFGTGGATQRVTFADIDGDGKLDVAASMNNTAVKVFHNNSTSGSVAFDATTTITGVGNSILGFSFGDMNGDGKTDLIVGERQNGKVSVVINNSTSGTISFASPVQFTGGSGTHSYDAGAADFDGDGKPDIVSTRNGGTNQIAVIRNVAVSGKNITATAGANGSLSPSGTVTVVIGANQSYTISPNAGYHVADVLVDGGSVGAVTSYQFLNVTASHTLQAYFSPTTYTISGNAGTDGVTMSYTDTIPKAVNSDGSGNYSFAVSYNWSGTVTPIRSTWTFSPANRVYSNVLSNQTSQNYTATQNTDTVFASAVNGTISPTGTVVLTQSANQRFTFAPNTGYHFDSLYVDGVKVDSSAGYTVYNISTEHTIAAYNSINTYSVTASSLSGTISPSGVQTVNHGSSIRFTYAPNGGELFDSVYVDGVRNLDSAAAFTFLNVITAHSITVYNSAMPLPVELVSFTAATNRLNAELKWATATEVNNYGFEIQRSEIRSQRSENNGHPEQASHSLIGAPKDDHWQKIGFVEGIGTSNSSHEYSFADKNLCAGKYSFRLKQIDRDGKFNYSQEVEVEIGSVLKTFALEQNFPNPFNPSTTIGFTLQVSGLTTLKVYNAIGQEVVTLVNEELEAGVYHQKIFDASKLASGIYFAKLSSGRKVQIRKLSLIK